MNYIVFAGGQGLVVLDICNRSGKRINGFFDNDVSKIGRRVGGITVLGSEEKIQTYCRQTDWLAIAMGDNYKRHETFAKLDGHFNLESLASSTAMVSDTAEIGYGCTIHDFATINTGVTIGNGVIVNTRSLIEHECRVGDFTFIAPGAILLGGVTVGDHSFIGVGALLRGHIKIGRNTVIGMGAVVTKDIPDGVVAYGNPVRIDESMDPYKNIDSLNLRGRLDGH